MSFRLGLVVRFPNTCLPMYVWLTIMFRTCEGRQMPARRRLRLPVSSLQADVHGIPVRFRWSAIFWHDFFSVADMRNIMRTTSASDISKPAIGVSLMTRRASFFAPCLR